MRFCCISGTNRQNSKTFVVSQYILSLFQKSCSFIDLAQTGLLSITLFYQDSSKIKKELSTIHHSHGVALVVPEYNSSYPGILKYFLDHWEETRTFDRVFYLVGIGGSMTSGRLALQDIRQVLLNQGGMIYPPFTCISEEDINEKLQQITQEKIIRRLQNQVKGFQSFVSKISQVSN